MTTYYGQEFEQPISAAKATKLLAPQPLPRMGYERDLVVTKSRGFTVRLVVLNISGQLLLACCNAARTEWKELFNVEPEGLA